ncbi:hypothetical protein BDZ85DRAFT_98557 [Elsinoe ampelina]|uniref:Uncharacterized protein n=1 Tax=Elsinoe ampelina TaxID=302913 RepID=A0A6A6GFI4_9PEZI|nr:hypothetical protein BDZ85DRAFT_98557 [Elsinoe ampelina]
MTDHFGPLDRPILEATPIKIRHLQISLFPCHTTIPFTLVMVHLPVSHEKHITMEDLGEQLKASEIRSHTYQRIAEDRAKQLDHQQAEYEVQVAQLKRQIPAPDSADEEDHCKPQQWLPLLIDTTRHHANVRTRSDVNLFDADLAPLLSAFPFNTTDAKLRRTLGGRNAQVLAIKFIGLESAKKENVFSAPVFPTANAAYVGTVAMLNVLTASVDCFDKDNRRFDTIVRELASLAESLTPDQVRRSGWVPRMRSMGKVHLAYQLALQMSKADDCLIFWLCTNLALTLHLSVPFENKSLWCDYLVAMLDGETYDDLDPFSKACWAKLVFTTVDQDTAHDLLGPEICEILEEPEEDEGLGVHSIYSDMIRYGDIIPAEDRNKFYQFHAAPDGVTHYHIVKSGHSTITLVGSDGYNSTEFVALIEPPKLSKDGVLWTLTWSPEYSLTVDTSKNYHGKPISPIAEMFPELCAEIED